MILFFLALCSAPALCQPSFVLTQAMLFGKSPLQSGAQYNITSLLDISPGAVNVSTNSLTVDGGAGGVTFLCSQDCFLVDNSTAVEVRPSWRVGALRSLRNDCVGALAHAQRVASIVFKNIVVRLSATKMFFTVRGLAYVENLVFDNVTLVPTVSGARRRFSRAFFCV